MPTGARFYRRELCDIIDRIHQCVHMPASGGGWIVGCNSQSVCVYCLRLHADLVWILHCYTVAETGDEKVASINSELQLTCTRLPSPSQSSCGWCTSWWAGTQPRSPGLLTVRAVQQTPGCWRSLGYILMRTTNNRSIRGARKKKIKMKLISSFYKTNNLNLSYMRVVKLTLLIWWLSTQTCVKSGEISFVVLPNQIAVTWMKTAKLKECVLECVTDSTKCCNDCINILFQTTNC